MALKITHPSGAEEWECPECGRKFVVKWGPNFKRVVLVEGDAQTTHAASKGGLHMSTPRITHSADEQTKIEDERLDVWLDHLNNIDFDSLLGGEPQS